MNTLSAGFGRVNVNPMMGIRLRGNGLVRPADGVLDDLEINALAVSDGARKAVLVALDNCALERECAVAFGRAVSEAAGIPRDAVYLHATHTHTAPFLRKTTDDPLEREYFQFVRRRMAEAAVLALDDLRPARMGWCAGAAPELAFVRRFRMKDGTTTTNPGFDNPDVVGPDGEADHRVGVLRFDRDGAPSLVLVNYGNHPDVIGGCKISADWPGALRREVERIVPGTRCVFFNGAMGDVNHVNLFPRLTGAERMGESAVGHGYAYARYMGRALACTVAQAFDMARYREVSNVSFAQRMVPLPVNVPDPADMPEARRLQALYRAKGLDALPGDEMERNTLVYETQRMIRFEHGPETLDVPVGAVAIGPVALVGAPGESFVGVGRALKETEGWDLVLPTSITNGYCDYLPTREAFGGGGFEVRTAWFKAGAAERLVEESRRLLASLAPRPEPSAGN